MGQERGQVAGELSRKRRKVMEVERNHKIKEINTKNPKINQKMHK